MTRHLILAIAPALALAAAAHAQPAGPPSHGVHGAPAAEMKAHHEAMQKQHLEDLRTILRLRPDQEPALAAFVEAHKPRTFEVRKSAPAAAQTTPQRLEQMAKHEAKMSEHQEQMRQALTKFYAALTPEQQKVFDALHRLKGPQMGRRMMMHDGHGDGGPRMMIRHHGGPDGPPPR